MKPDTVRALAYLENISAYATSDGGILFETPQRDMAQRKAVLVIDSSGSMQGTEKQVSGLVELILAGLPDGTPVDVLSFNATVDLVMSTDALTDADRKKAIQAFQSCLRESLTNLGAALQQVVDRVCELPTSYTILITDGQATVGEKSTAVLAAMIPEPHDLDVLMLTPNADSDFARKVQLANVQNYVTYISAVCDIPDKQHAYANHIQKRAPASKPVRFLVAGGEQVRRQRFVYFDTEPDPDLPVRFEYDDQVLQTKLGNIHKGEMKNQQQVDFFARQTKLATQLHGLRKDTQECDDWEKVFTPATDELLHAPEKMREEFEAIDLGPMYRSLAIESLQTAESFVASMATIQKAVSDSPVSPLKRSHDDSDHHGSGHHGACFRSLSVPHDGSDHHGSGHHGACFRSLSVPHAVVALPSTMD